MDKDMNMYKREPLSIIRNDDKLVVIRNMCRTSFDVANNPWLSLDIDYITVTKGADHVLTVIDKDGSTGSFEWGNRGTTCISSATQLLKDNVLKFLRDNGVYVGLTSRAIDVRQWKIDKYYAVRVDGEDGSYDVSYFEKEEEAEKFYALVKIGEEEDEQDLKEEEETLKDLAAKELAQRTYVVIIDEYDDDSNTNERLISCATFNTYDKAKAYMSAKTFSYMHNSDKDEVEVKPFDVTATGVDDTVRIYDGDGILLMKLSVIETVVDEFVTKD